MSRLNHEALACSTQGCSQRASIIHASAPYCGKHALEKWHLEEEAAHGRPANSKELLPSED
jgi:hypothetical protein